MRQIEVGQIRRWLVDESNGIRGFNEYPTFLVIAIESVGSPPIDFIWAIDGSGDVIKFTSEWASLCSEMIS